MGNSHVCTARIPAITTAVFSSSALALLVLSGISCSFLEIRAKKGQLLYVPDSTYPPMDTSTSMGVICGSDLYDELLRDDLMYIVSRICLYVAIAAGSITCIISWAISTYVGPTYANWKLLSVFSAVGAILQMPVFLIFETDPCTAFSSEQECLLDDGSFFLILSTILCVAVTLATQFLDPPNWAEELDAWRVKRSADRHGEVQPGSPLPASGGSLRDDNTIGGDSYSPLLKKTKRGFLSGIQRLTEQRHWARDAELPKNQTGSMSQDEEEEIPGTQIVRYKGDDNNSRLVLNVLPNGKRPGDDSKSVPSYEDLDSLVEAAEEGRLPECHSPAASDDKVKDAKTGSPCQWDNKSKEQLEFSEALVVVNSVQKRLVNEIYTNLETPKSNVNEDRLIPGGTPADSQNVISPENPSSQPDASTGSPSKASHIIQNLTESLKKRSRIRRSKKNEYALMDDNNMESTYPVLPREVIFNNNETDPMLHLELPGTPTRQAEFGPAFLDALQKQASFDSGDYPDPIISIPHCDDDDTSEEDPDPIICSNSFEGDVVSHDDDSTHSSQSSDTSDSNSDDCRQRDMGGRRRGVPQKRRRVRSRSHGISSTQSAVSCTSLLDTTIEEETDADLKEFGVECNDRVPYDLVRSRSAPSQLQPQQVGCLTRRVLTSDTNTEESGKETVTFNTAYAGSAYSVPAEHRQVGFKDVQLAPITPSKPKAQDCFKQNSPLEKAMELSSTGESRAPQEGTNDVAPRSVSASFDGELKGQPNSISYSSDPDGDYKPSGIIEAPPSSCTTLNAPENYKKPDPIEAPPSPSTTFTAPEDEKYDGKPDPVGETLEEASQSTDSSFEAEIMSWIEERGMTIDSFQKSAGSPALTAPETPSSGLLSPDSRNLDVEEENKRHDLSSSFESEKSWKEERELRGGIHAAPIDDLGDDSSDGNDENPSTLRGRVREARIRRLQIDSQEVLNRRRARTLDPPTRYRPKRAFGMTNAVDTLDLQLIEVLRPDGFEYGPDERSL